MYPTPKPKLRRLCLALALFFALFSASYAQTGAGSIEGRVLNATNGSYLNNARVAVEGTSLQTFTDAAGRYRLDGVPIGSAKVHAFYTGLPEQVQTVEVTPGGTAAQDFDLGAGTATKTGDVLKLDAFTVQSRREMDAASLAINEQRFAGTIKNVVNTDAFGDIAEGNVGDFVKFLPGVTIDYVSPDARTISIRGVPPQYTLLMLNGNPVASASSSSASRTVELEQISLNNASRIEITKSRSPEQPANALGGAVNLIPRTAFEYTKPSFSYRAFLSLNGDEKDFGKTRGPTNESSRKIKPGFDLLYVAPLTKNFGITVSVLESNIFYPQHRSQPIWGPYNGTQAGASPEHPVLRQYQVQDGPKNNQRESVGMTADWRFAPHDVLSLGFQWSFYNAFFGNRPVTYTLGNTAPTSTNGAAFDGNGAFFHGANGTGTVNLASSFRRKYGYTYQPDLNWRHNGPIWKMDAGAAFSHSSNHYHDYQDSHFENVQINLRGNPTGTTVGNATVRFDDIDKGSYLYPRISVYNNTGTTQLNLADPANYNVTSAGENPADSVDQFRSVRANVGRDMNLSFPFVVKTGFRIQEQVRDIRKDNPGTWTFVGPDGKANTADDNLALYDLLDTQYSSRAYLYNTPQVPSPDPYKFWSLYKAHPEYFQAPSAATLIQNTAVNSNYFKETITAAYMQADARLLNNRLRIVGGLRFEQTNDSSQGILNNPNAAKGITDPVAAAKARYGYRVNHVKSQYAAGYPSLDIGFDVTHSLIARVAYSRAIGRPELSYILPNLNVPDESTVGSGGTITINNSALAPTQVDNYDASLEYYFTKTGVFSVGAFQKEFSNFQGAQNVPATVELLSNAGVPNPELYVGGAGTFTISTRMNVGQARVSGVEFNYKQVLDYDWLPTWANNAFTVFANGQKMHLEGAATADFSNFIRESASWGIAYAARSFTVQTNFNYRGRQRLGQQTFTWTDGSGTHSITGYEYWKPRVYLDANAEFRFKPWMSFFINARNLTNVAQDIQRYAPVVTPSWARTYRREEFGVQYTIGVKGKF